MQGFATLSVATILAESAVRHADRTAVVVGDERITYRELWDQTRAVAGALRARGVGPGTRVALLLPNVADFPRAYYAVLALGGVVVPVHALLQGPEIQYVLEDSESSLLVCAAPLLTQGLRGARAAGVDVVSVLAPAELAAQHGLDRLEELTASAEPITAVEPRQPDDTATILYTSGTTGRPKGAEGCHLSLVAQVETSLLDTFRLGPDDVVLGCLPLFHTFGQTCAMNTAFRAGAALVLVPRFDGASALSLMVEHGCTVVMGVPTMYMAFLEAAAQDERRPPLRYGVSGGAAIPLAVIERFQAVFGAPVHEGYGLTETSPVATFNPVGRTPRPGTVGVPIWGVEVEVARHDVLDRVELLPRGELGELVVRGHNLMKGYLGRPEDTAAAVVDGWFRTGDLGRKDEDDYVTVVDRTKDMILRNGYNVYPREVEEVLAAHPDVARVAVFGVADDRHGEEVVAAVVLVEGATATPEDLRHHAADRVAAYKYPRRVEVVDELPLGPSGKVLKRELVARFRSPADGRDAEPAT